MGYLAGSTGELLWRDTRRDPLLIYSGILSGILGGIHWRATLAQYSAGSTGELLWDTQRDNRRDPLAGCSGGIWRDIRRDRSGGILGGIHWRAVLAEYSAGSTGEPLGGILGGIHWRAALAGYSVGSTCEPLWWDSRRDPLASSSGGILLL